MKCILAYDVGGTSLRAGLVTVSGALLCMASVSFAPPVMDAAGFSEKDPEDWWSGFIKATDALLKAPAGNGAEIAALAISGLTRTQVFLDSEGKSVRRAMTWADGRATEQAERITGKQTRLGADGKCFGPVNAFHTLPRVLWLMEQEPAVFDRVETVLEPKDYLNFLLTGEIAGDWLSLSRILKVSDMTLASVLLQEIGLPAGIFPPLRAPWEQVGAIRPGLAHPLDRLAGIPVFAGSMDAWCGALGIGAAQSGLAFNASGTSEVFGIGVTNYMECPGLVTQPWGKGLFLLGGPSQAGADCLAWYMEAFEGQKHGTEPGAGLRRLQAMERQPEPVLFLPYLRGERVPLWEPDARGLFIGFNRRHGQADFLWAVMEGVAFSNRQILESATMDGDAVKEVRITGGAGESDAWCQTKADVLKLPLVRTRCKEAAILGAAMVALTGMGEYTDIRQCQGRLVEVERVFAPRTERRGFYDRLFHRWIEVQGALLPVTRSLTKDVREGFAAARR